MEFMTKTDYAYKRLRDEILSGKIPSGSKLVVNELAKEYNVSSMPIRNAITRLEDIGLVKTVPHVGSTVDMLDLDGYFSLMLMRLELESLAAFFTAIYRTDETLEELETLQKQLAAARDEHDLDSYAKINRKIHKTVNAACQSPTLIDQINILYERTRVSLAYFNTLPQTMDQSFREHEFWLDTIRSKDGDKSADLIRYQRSRANLQMLELIRESANDPDAIDKNIFYQSLNTPGGFSKIQKYVDAFEWTMGKLGAIGDILGQGAPQKGTD